VIGSYKKIRPKASSFAISNAERKRIINKHRRTAQEIQKARDRNRNLTFENVGQYQYQQRPFNFSNLSNLSNLPHFETVSRFLGGVGN
jgi:hypothetical protein